LLESIGFKVKIMDTKQITDRNINLFSESFGSPNNPPILLIMGATASGIWWPEAFCQQLADLDRFVIRYDHRDTGRSTSYEPGQSHYSVEDLADDALAILDAYQLKHAHLVGMSLGGFLAQLLALKTPNAVKSLTLIASERLAAADPALPAMDASVMDYHAQGTKLDWTDREAVIEYQLGLWRLLAGSAHPLDETLTRKLAADDFDRTPNLLTKFNHALLQGGDRWLNRLHDISVPTLIVHGTEDIVLPYAHALALQSEISNSTLLTLEGTGHELHPEDWSTILTAIQSHTFPSV
jgi:pimeloyl-ACP methyl ester carboxylesterase